MMKKCILSCLCFAWSASCIHAVEVTDVLTANEIAGVAYGRSQTYTSPVSGVTYVYAGAKNTSLIQFNDPAKSGISVSKSRGVLKSMVIELDQNCTKGYSIYASKKEYEGYSNTVTKGDLISNGLGVSPEPVSFTQNFEDGERAFYLRPGGAATYIKSITVLWDVVPQAQEPVISSSNGFTFYPSTDVTFGAVDGATIYYSIDVELTADNYNTVGTVYSGTALTLDKDAVVYALAVEDGKDPSDVVSHKFTCALLQPGVMECVFTGGLYTYREGTNGTVHEDESFDKLVYQANSTNKFVQPVNMIQWGDFLFDFDNNGASIKVAYYSGSPGELRVYNAVVTTLLRSVDPKKKMTKVVFHMKDGYTDDFVSCNVGSMSLSKEDHTLTWICDEGASNILFGKASSQQRWTSVDIYYQKAVDVNTSFSPVLSSSAGMDFYPSTEISIVSADGSGDNVSIYYNINSDEDPTSENGISYQGPFTVDETAIVKAIAIDGDKAPSEVGMIEVRRIPEHSFADIAALLTAEPTPALAEVVRFANPVTITGSYKLTNNNTYYLYVQDESGELLIYSTTAFPESYVPGAVIDGFVMNYQVYQDLPEGVATEYIASFAEPLRTGAAPMPSSVGMVDASLYNHYVRFDDVAVADGKIQTDPLLTVQNKFAGHKPPTWNIARSYNITGMVGHDSNIDKLYYLEAEELPVGPSPQIYLEEDFPELSTFGVEATFGADVAGSPDAVIYYTVDGSDPIGNPDAMIYDHPVPLTMTTTVRAYAKIAGMSPSEVVERTFVKEGNEILYIKDFIGWNDTSAPVDFVGEVVVLAQSADYLFVEDKLGSSLAIKAPGGWSGKTYSAGDRLAGFSIMHPDQPVANVALAIADVSTFGNAVSSGVAIYKRVGETEAMDVSNYGRPIVIADAHLEINELSRDGNGWSVNASMPVDFSQFGDIAGWPLAADEAAVYTITGVVMPDAGGVPELWPMAIEADSGDLTAAPRILGAEQFERQTTIEIQAVSGAVVYYTVDGSEPSVGESASVMIYSEPFVITATTIVKAIAVIDGKEPSAVVSVRFIETIATGVESVEATEVAIYGTVGMIEAPDGAEVYDLSGRRILRKNIVPGIYVVRYAGKIYKVSVR